MKKILLASLIFILSFFLSFSFQIVFVGAASLPRLHTEGRCLPSEDEQDKKEKEPDKKEMF